MSDQAVEPAVRCRGLRKSYGKHVALDGLNLDVPAGSLFGLLGPNGAGKSTTLRILAGLVRAQAGDATLFGVPATQHVAAARNTSFLIENAVFPGHLTARRVLKRTADYMRAENDDTLLERVGIPEAADRKVGGFSHGMRQRLGLACALLGRPHLLVLDEPQNGLDPEGLRMIRGILAEEHERGATILVSVHRLAEVEGLCTDAAIMASGKALRAGRIEDLLAEERPRYRLVVDDAMRAESLLRERHPDLYVENGALVFRAEKSEAATAAAALVQGGVRMFELAPIKRSLDELYRTEVNAS
ncbi:MAG: ABC transporter ATP-binding protein [Planctomycetota bacterium]